jgi:hypothetical protein
MLLTNRAAWLSMSAMSEPCTHTLGCSRHMTFVPVHGHLEHNGLSVCRGVNTKRFWWVDT